MSGILSVSSVQLAPDPSDFAHRSRLHGQAHVARVMVHAFRLLDATGLAAEARRLWAAVFLHDLARTHDGVCRRHGADAVTKWRTSPALAARLASHGIRPDEGDDGEAVALAVTAHCLPDRREPPPGQPHRTLVALLKDADGLDRVRLGDLDPAFFRLPETRTMVPFAEELFARTAGRIPEGADHFPALLAAAAAIDGREVLVPRALLDPKDRSPGAGSAAPA